MLLGVFAARRAVRPVAEAAQAAKAIAGGHLGTRLPPTDDPDLGVLASSFNDMASALQLRIERDARFASDVSHELRSPLMTLSASVEVMEARRHELPERAQAALDLLTSDVSRFQGLVEDLLEISRFDAGAIRLHLEDLPVAQFVRQRRRRQLGAATPRSRRPPRAERASIRGDRRRLARVIANLIDNARAYGGGEPEVTITDANPPDEPLTHVQIGVEDHGPGVPDEERALIFERFARGVTAGRRSGSEGAGLGLALVDEHVRMHGGRVWVEDRIDGEPGARFVIELLAAEADDRRADAADGRRRWREASPLAAAARRRRARRVACAIQPDPAPATSRPTSGACSTGRRPRRRAGRASRIYLLTSDETAASGSCAPCPRRRSDAATAVLDELFKGPTPTSWTSGFDTASPTDLVLTRRAPSPARSPSTSPRRSSSCPARRCDSPSPRSCSRPRAEGVGGPPARRRRDRAGPTGAASSRSALTATTHRPGWPVDTEPRRRPACHAS